MYHARFYFHSDAVRAKEPDNGAGLLLPRVCVIYPTDVIHTRGRAAKNKRNVI